MYCIVHRWKNESSPDYLAWQSPAWDDDGYFWTSKETFQKCLYNNTPEHPFLFKSKADAVRHLKLLKIPQKCSVIEWTA